MTCPGKILFTRATFLAFKHNTVSTGLLGDIELITISGTAQVFLALYGPAFTAERIYHPRWFTSQSMPIESAYDKLYGQVSEASQEKEHTNALACPHDSLLFIPLHRATMLGVRNILVVFRTQSSDGFGLTLSTIRSTCGFTHPHDDESVFATQGAILYG